MEGKDLTLATYLPFFYMFQSVGGCDISAVILPMTVVVSTPYCWVSMFVTAMTRQILDTITHCDA